MLCLVASKASPLGPASPAAGVLPPKWGRMFPQLSILRLANNNLFAQPAAPGDLSSGRAAKLPSAWTQSTYPIAFPSLVMLVLYPGNDLICFLPSSSSDEPEGLSEVNPGGWL
jgi:hypothetical protein